MKEYILDFTMVFFSAYIVFDKESSILFKIPAFYSLILHLEYIFRKLIREE